MLYLLDVDAQTGRSCTPLQMVTNLLRSSVLYNVADNYMCSHWLDQYRCLGSDKDGFHIHQYLVGKVTSHALIRCR